MTVATSYVATVQSVVTVRDPSFCRKFWSYTIGQFVKFHCVSWQNVLSKFRSSLVATADYCYWVNCCNCTSYWRLPSSLLVRVSFLCTKRGWYTRGKCFLPLPRRLCFHRCLFVC